MDWIELAVRAPQWTEPDRNDPGVERRFHAISEFGGSYFAGSLHRDGNNDSRYKRDVRPECEAQVMIDMTYDPEADAVYLLLARAKVDRTEEAGPFICDLDAEGRICGVEILSASKVLAPDDWQRARRPGARSADAAE